MVSIPSSIHDNHKRGPVGDFLKEKIQKDAELSIVSAYFDSTRDILREVVAFQEVDA
jgi:hypothetical protein